MMGRNDEEIPFTFSIGLSSHLTVFPAVSISLDLTATPVDVFSA
jgi:hypothetical protein